MSGDCIEICRQQQVHMTFYFQAYKSALSHQNSGNGGVRCDPQTFVRPKWNFYLDLCYCFVLFFQSACAPTEFSNRDQVSMPQKMKKSSPIFFLVNLFSKILKYVSQTQSQRDNQVGPLLHISLTHIWGLENKSNHKISNQSENSTLESCNFTV